MRLSWTSLKKRKKAMLFLSILFILGLVSGFIYFNKINDTIVINLQEKLLDIKFNSNIWFHIIFLALIFFFSALLIGSLFGLFVYFYESLSIGFIIGVYFSYGGLAGVMYSIIYVLIYKAFYIFFLSVILIKTFDIGRNLIGYFVFKKDDELKNKVIINFILIIKLALFIIIYDLFLTFFGNNILSIFSFLI